MGTALSAGLALARTTSNSATPSNAFETETCEWRVVPSEDPHPALVDLFTSVAVVTHRDAWATGDFNTGQEGGPQGAFIEHWNGRSWQLADAPIPEGADLWSASASGRADVWAVGAAEYGGQLVMHWDGRHWEQSTPPQAKGGIPFAVAARAEDDVWAVGVAKHKPLTEHWDGRRWTVVRSPTPPSAHGRGGFAILTAVTAISPTDVWAAGYRSGVRSRSTRTLIEHWDGRRWAIVPSPNTRSPRGVVNNILFSISGAADNDVWAVGSWGSRREGYGGGGDHALALHWDGSRWSSIPASALTGRSLLSSVVATGSQVWAVGDMGVQADRRPLILRWDGEHLSPVAAPPGFDLASVASEPAGNFVMAVGGTRERPLAARCVRRVGPPSERGRARRPRCRRPDRRI